MIARLFDLVGSGTPAFRLSDAARAGLGALAGLALTGLIARFIGGGDLALGPLLVGPIGASAVLVFAAPASPLAQPRAVIGGNALSAVIGVACAALIPEPFAAAAIAVALAIAAMALTGCLHPPGGATALTAVIGGPAVVGLGFGFVLVPVALCSILLVLAGIGLNRAMGRSYPHKAPAPTPGAGAGYAPVDLDRALAQYGELLDVSRDDLDALFREVELQAHRRLHSVIFCADIMSRDVVTVNVDQSAESAFAFLQSHDMRTAPVIDSERRVVGMVRRAELLTAGHRAVAAALDPFVHKVRESTPIEALLPILSSGAAHEALVVDASGVIQGIITQTDLLAVLYRAHVVEAVISDRKAA